MSQLPTDEQMALAIQHRKDLFTSRFMREKIQGGTRWSSMDNWYFEHICTVLNHAKKVFETPVDDLVNNTDIDD